MFPSQPIQIRPNVNQQPQEFFTNSQVFGKPNFSRPNPNLPQPSPTPMSISTNQTSNRFRPNNNPNFNNFRPPQFTT